MLWSCLRLALCRGSLIQLLPLYVMRSTANRNGCRLTWENPRSKHELTEKHGRWNHSAYLHNSWASALSLSACTWGTRLTFGPLRLHLFAWLKLHELPHTLQIKRGTAVLISITFSIKHALGARSQPTDLVLSLRLAIKIRWNQQKCCKGSFADHLQEAIHHATRLFEKPLSK